MKDCPCGSGLGIDDCCGPVLAGTALAETAEALMRARYSAYIENNIPFLGESLHPDHRNDWDEAATRRWANDSEWQSLEILTTQDGLALDETGLVEFVAVYKEKGALRRHHEISRFEKIKDRWYYVEGEMPKPKTQRHETPKVGRNDPCPCGSGKKYKKCCGR